MNLINNICKEHHLSLLKVCLTEDCVHRNIFCSECEQEEESKHIHKEQLLDYEKFFDKIGCKFEKIYSDKQNKINRYSKKEMLEEFRKYK